MGLSHQKHRYPDGDHKIIKTMSDDERQQGTVPKLHTAEAKPGSDKCGYDHLTEIAGENVKQTEQHRGYDERRDRRTEDSAEFFKQKAPKDQFFHKTNRKNTIYKFKYKLPPDLVAVSGIHKVPEAGQMRNESQNE